MVLMNWKDEYNTGIVEIDEQHKMMFDIINDLYNVMHASSETAGLDEILKQVINYADHHFILEESRFKEVGYEGAEAHLTEHQSYRDKINELVQEYGNDKKLLSFQLIDFLEDWWIEHVTDTDKEYVEYIKKTN